MGTDCIDDFIASCKEIVLFYKNGEYKNHKNVIKNLCHNCKKEDLDSFIAIDKAFAEVHNCIHKLTYLGSVRNDNETIAKIAKVTEKFSEAMNSTASRALKEIINEKCDNSNVHYLMQIICNKFSIPKNHKEYVSFRKTIIASKLLIVYNGKEVNLLINGEYTGILLDEPNEKLRKQIYYKKFAGIEKNKKIIETIQHKRHADAIAHGCANYAEYIMARSRYNSPADMIGMLGALKKKFLDDTKVLRNDVQKTHFCDCLLPWNTLFIAKEYCKNFAIKKLQFPMQQTINRTIVYFCKQYDYTYEELHDHKTWHKDVIVCGIKKNNQLFAIVYLDLYPRNGKYTHAMMTPLVTPALGVAAVIEIAITMNMTPGNNIVHDDLVVFAHELGHAFHHIVCTIPTNYYFANGINCLKRDEIEISSTHFESFAHNDDFLSFLLGKQIVLPPKEMAIIEQFRKIKRINHIAMAIADLRLNSAVKEISYDEINKYYIDELAGYDKNCHLLTFLYHYEKYPANYYSYLVGEWNSPTPP
jgi:Zn-dependent oligopeptidase